MDTKGKILAFIRNHEHVSGKEIAEHIGITRQAINKHIIELIKGKRTTMPDRHTGEGVFFTSKSGDEVNFRSHRIRIIFDNQKTSEKKSGFYIPRICTGRL